MIDPRTRPLDRREKAQNAQETGVFSDLLRFLRLFAASSAIVSRISDLRFQISFWLGVCALVAGAAEFSEGEPIPPLRPPRPEIDPGLWERYGIWFILGCILLVLLAVGTIWLLTRSKPPPIPQPALVARNSLRPLFRQPETGEVLSRVSQVLRRYFSAAFGLAGGELTTAEFCCAIAGVTTLKPELAGKVGAFLRECDERKFAPSSGVVPLGAVQRADMLIAEAETQRAELQAAVAAQANEPARKTPNATASGAGSPNS